MFTGSEKWSRKTNPAQKFSLQVAAIRAALNKVSRIVIEIHVGTYMKDAASSGDTEQHLEELKDALSKLI